MYISADIFPTFQHDLNSSKGWRYNAITVCRHCSSLRNTYNYVAQSVTLSDNTKQCAGGLMW